MTLFSVVIDFLKLDSWSQLFHQSVSLSAWMSLDCLRALLTPLVPCLLIVEAGWLLLRKRFAFSSYKIALVTHYLNSVLSKLITVDVVAWCIHLFEPHAPFHANLTWYGFIYGYLIWELSHYIFHYMSHRVRLFWCFHSVHHAPAQMNLSVIYVNHIFSDVHANFVRTSVCILLGVHPSVLIGVMIFDGVWGSLIHVSEALLPKDALKVLNRFVLTPDHHRIHHASNPRYFDKNFCNFLPIWDWLFGTLQHPEPDVPFTYGIARKIDSNSAIEVYFVEKFHLWRDMKHARNLREKVLYMLRRPGWSPAGRILPKALSETDVANMRGQ